jgi:hypothetical protein
LGSATELDSEKAMVMEQEMAMDLDSVKELEWDLEKATATQKEMATDLATGSDLDSDSAPDSTADDLDCT